MNDDIGNMIRDKILDIILHAQKSTPPQDIDCVHLGMEGLKYFKKHAPDSCQFSNRTGDVEKIMGLNAVILPSLPARRVVLKAGRNTVGAFTI
jgi:hypothetical protein